jgi:hypothetical protein
LATNNLGSHEVRSICVLNARLTLATRVELDRLCKLLSIKEGASVQDVEQAYLNAADNSIFNMIRSLVPNEAPTYLKALILIYKELRSYSEALDETWVRVKNLQLFDYVTPIEDMHEPDLEEKILELYSAGLADAKTKKATDPSFLKTLTKYLPGVGSAGAGTATAVAAHTASRLPFAALGPGALAGPVGIALGVIMIGASLSGPAFRKIVPATVEILLIGRRIQFTPKE